MGWSPARQRSAIPIQWKIETLSALDSQLYKTRRDICFKCPRNHVTVALPGRIRAAEMREALLRDRQR